MAAFSAFTMAQDTTTTTPTPDKATKRARVERAQGRMAGRTLGDHHGKRGAMLHGLRGIELTDAQKAQIKTIRESNRPDEATMKELRAIHEARKAGTAITPEQKERLKAFREQSAAKAKSVHEQIQAVLTPEQKAQIEKRNTEMRQRFEERRQNRKQRPTRVTTDNPVIK